jgi:ATP-binding cassette subfamily F protein uup
VTVNLVNLESVAKVYGIRQVFQAVSLGVESGDRVGVVGRNGDGKSTLLRLIARAEQPDSGRVTHVGGLRVGRLGQHDDLDPAQTVREAVVGDRPDHEWAGRAAVREMLSALLPTVWMEARIGLLSGGERRRVALARLLMRDDDLLLLDEPTNHLDVEAIDWLARHLASAGRSLVVVSHDRWLLDTVCEALWEVVDGGVQAYEGGYAAYVLARAERARVAAAGESRRQNVLRKELAWLRRGPPARTSKPRFRIEAANALIADEPPPRNRYELARFATARLGKSVYDVEDVSVELGGRELMDRVTWRLGPADRVGVVGVNGSGKTTLLRLLDGSLRPTAGKVRVGRTVAPAYLSQEVTELDPQARVLEAVEDVRRVSRVESGESTAGQLLDRFGFVGERQWSRIGELSGGERRRLQLLRLLMEEPNVLLLDEPTNDLDIKTLTVLEDLLDDWPGTLVVVSHDRWFLERVTDAIWALLGDGSLVHLPGGVDEYLARRRTAAERPRVQPTRGGRRHDSRTARKELARLERELDRLARREDALHVELAAHATDPDRVMGLDAALRDVHTQREAAEERWLEFADELEQQNHTIDEEGDR